MQEVISELKIRPVEATNFKLPEKKEKDGDDDGGTSSGAFNNVNGNAATLPDHIPFSNSESNHNKCVTSPSNEGNDSGAGENVNRTSSQSNNLYTLDQSSAINNNNSNVPTNTSKQSSDECNSTKKMIEELIIAKSQKAIHNQNYLYQANTDKQVSFQSQTNDISGIDQPCFIQQEEDKPKIVNPEKSFTEKVLNIVGLIVANIMAVVCGAIAADAFSGNPAEMAIAGVSGAVMNGFIYSSTVPNTFITFDIKKTFSDIDIKRKFGLGLAIVLSGLGSIALGAIAWTSLSAILVKLLLLFGASVAIAHCPFIIVPIVGIFVGITFFANYGLMFNFMKNIILGNPIETIKNFFSDLFSHKDKNISATEHSFKTTIKIICMLALFAIAAIATIFTIHTWGTSLLHCIGKIPHISTVLADKLADAIIFGPTLFARMPFIIRSVCVFGNKLGNGLSAVLIGIGKGFLQFCTSPIETITSIPQRIQTCTTNIAQKAKSECKDTTSTLKFIGKTALYLAVPFAIAAFMVLNAAGNGGIAAESGSFMAHFFSSIDLSSLDIAGLTASIFSFIVAANSVNDIAEKAGWIKNDRPDNGSNTEDTKTLAQPKNEATVMPEPPPEKEKTSTSVSIKNNRVSNAKILAKTGMLAGQNSTDPENSSTNPQYHQVTVAAGLGCS